MKRKSKINDNLKTVVRTTTIMIFITVLGFYLFNLYINIDIQSNNKNTTYHATKTVRNSRGRN
ncbi:MAG: hypothetical protein HFJ58_04395 [Clostridia bacterium]|nr:hypothetical protein [Clostridia bacterium]